MAPLAPGLFSMAIGWPRNCCILSAMMRAVKSAVPPGANATIRCTGRVGKSSAKPMREQHVAAMTNDAMRRTVVAKFNRMEKRTFVRSRVRECEGGRTLAICRSARQALNCRAAAAELVFQPLETAIEVIDAVDDGFAFGGERGDDERHRGAQIGRHHRRALERLDDFDGRGFTIEMDARAK